MFKNIISPVQAWLMSQGRCVGCGTPLSKGKREKFNEYMEKVACKKCGRIFVYDIGTKKYRRAELKEA